MKKNLMPKMVDVNLLDKEGSMVPVSVKLIQHNQREYLFLSDKGSSPESSIARNTAAFIAQLVERFQLDTTTVSFFRHIYTPESGSVFGHFSIDWQAGKPVSYTFKVLSNYEQVQKIQTILLEGTAVALSYSQLKNIAVSA